MYSGLYLGGPYLGFEFRFLCLLLGGRYLDATCFGLWLVLNFLPGFLWYFVCLWLLYLGLGTPYLVFCGTNLCGCEILRYITFGFCNAPYVGFSIITMGSRLLYLFSSLTSFLSFVILPLESTHDTAMVI